MRRDPERGTQKTPQEEVRPEKSLKEKNSQHWALKEGHPWQETACAKAWRPGTMLSVLTNSGWLEAGSRRKEQEVRKAAQVMYGKPRRRVSNWLPR